MEHEAFKGRTADFSRLRGFGFQEKDGKLHYSEKIADGEFVVNVCIDSRGEVSATTTDVSTGEPYTLHMTSDAVGAFVQRVRDDFDALMQKISDNCFFYGENLSPSAEFIVNFAREKFSAEPEYLWKDYPNYFVLRRRDNIKWFAVFMVVGRKKLGASGDGDIEIIDLRAEPDEIDRLTSSGADYFRGYHMNKKHWLTLTLDGAISHSELAERLCESYRLAK